MRHQEYLDNSRYAPEIIEYTLKFTEGISLYDVAEEFSHLTEDEYRDSMSRALGTRKIKIDGFTVYPKSHKMPRRNRTAKLHDEDIKRIKEMLDAGYIQPFIAKVFNVDSSTISRIHTGDTWKDE